MKRILQGYRSFIAIFVVAIIAVFATGYFSQARAGDCYSDGVRVGTIQKFSQKGLVNKSWEGELVMDGTKISGNQAGVRGGNVWAFSVLDPAVARVIDDATMSGGPVSLRYCQTLFPMFHTDTPYRITQAALRQR